MRINSEFSDYYDTVQSEGQDQSLVYQRHKTEGVIEFYPFHSGGNHPTRNQQVQIVYKSHHIGFCGKIYPVLEMIPGKYAELNPKEIREHRRWCYSLEDVDAFVKSNFKDTTDYFKKGYLRKSNWSSYDRRNAFESFFQKNKEYEKSMEIKSAPLFENMRPIFVAVYEPEYSIPRSGQYRRQISSGKVTYNCPLKQFEFYRIMPPFQAFQEISMWLSNQAVPFKPIPEMTNQIKIEARGFDKFSFRKDPKKKKK